VVVDVDAVERVGEAVGIAFAAHLPIADDVDACALLIAERHERRGVLRTFEPWRGHPPQIVEPHARRQARAEAFAVDQPFGLRVGPHHGGRERAETLGERGEGMRHNT